MPAELIHLVDGETQNSDSATYRLRLPSGGSLHSLIIRMSMTNGSTAGRGVGMLDVFDEVRITSARQNPLFSLSSEEIEKWYETEHGKAIVHDNTEVADAVQTIQFPIMFGRELYDPEFFLPLSKFASVDLEIDYSPTISATVGFATGTFTIDVYALVTDEGRPLPMQGTLVTRRIETFTTLVSADHKVELPDNALIRKVGAYCYEAGIEDGVDVTRIRLLDSARRNPIFDMDWLEFMNAQALWGAAPVEHTVRAFIQDNDTLNVRLGNIRHGNVDINEIAEIAADFVINYYIETIAGDLLTIGGALLDLVAGSEAVTLDTTDRDIFISAYADVPGMFGFIPYMYPDDPSGWLDVQQTNGLEILYTQGGAGGSLQTSIQELMKF